MSTLKNFIGVVLAGGSSVRMGQHKALLKFGNESLIQHVITNTLACFSNVAVVTRKDNDLHRHLDPIQVAVLYDRPDEQGPMAGIATACKAYPQNPLFILGCDMPFLSHDLIREFCNLYNPKAMATLLVLEGITQFLGGIYSAPQVLHGLEQQSKFEPSPKHFLKDYGNCIQNVEPSSFGSPEAIKRAWGSLNTPEDYQKALDIGLDP